jgi:hypothetical protein
MKLSGNSMMAKRQMVAPRAGAWIETKMTACVTTCCRVAPRAGAWIETGVFLDVPTAFKALSRNFIVHAANLYYRKLHPNIIVPVSNEARNYDQQLDLLDTTAMPDTIRKLVKEGPYFLGPQAWISDWTW